MGDADWIPQRTCRSRALEHIYDQKLFFASSHSWNRPSRGEKGFSKASVESFRLAEEPLGECRKRSRACQNWAFLVALTFWSRQYAYTPEINSSTICHGHIRIGAFCSRTQEIFYPASGGNHVRADKSTFAGITKTFGYTYLIPLVVAVAFDCTGFRTRSMG